MPEDQCMLLKVFSVWQLESLVTENQSTTVSFIIVHKVLEYFEMLLNIKNYQF